MLFHGSPLRLLAWAAREISPPENSSYRYTKACKYAVGLWERLGVFLRDGRIQIDNNIVENSIRPLALGRKNWMHIGSEQAGPVIAAIVSIFETSRRLEINPRTYLRDVLPRLGDCSVTRVHELTPMAWKFSRPPG